MASAEAEGEEGHRVHLASVSPQRAAEPVHVGHYHLDPLHAAGCGAIDQSAHHSVGVLVRGAEPRHTEGVVLDLRDRPAGTPLPERPAVSRGDEVVVYVDDWLESEQDMRDILAIVDALAALTVAPDSGANDAES